MNDTITTNGFVFAVVDEETALNLYYENESVYQVYADGDTRLCTDHLDVYDILNFQQLAIKIGEITSLQAEYEEGAANRYRNNDATTFESWLSSKAESLIN